MTFHSVCLWLHPDCLKQGRVICNHVLCDHVALVNAQSIGVGNGAGEGTSPPPPKNGKIFFGQLSCKFREFCYLLGKYRKHLGILIIFRAISYKIRAFCQWAFCQFFIFGQKCHACSLKVDWAPTPMPHSGIRIAFPTNLFSTFYAHYLYYSM